VLELGLSEAEILLDSDLDSDTEIDLDSEREILRDSDVEIT
jgi:hypothetical protein